MKRIFFMAVCLMAAWSLSAQMTVWSNGESVYSRSVENVDSISFDTPTSAQVMTQQAPAATSLVGKVYLFALADKTNAPTATSSIVPGGFAFYSNTGGYFFENMNHSPAGSNAKINAFTYTISGQDITISLTDIDCVAQGKIIGTKALVIYESSKTSTIGKGTYFNME